MTRKHFWTFVIIFFAGFLAYANSFTNQFVYDDLSAIVQNPKIKNLDFASIYLSNPSRFTTTLSFALNYAVGGTNVVGFHLVNFMIHIAAGTCVYFLMEILLNAGSLVSLKREAHLISLFTALLFVLHPLQTESVTFISQRGTSLAALFYLFSLVLYGLGLKHKNKLYYFLLIISAFLAWITKENTYTLVLALCMLQIYIEGFSKKTIKSVLKRLTPLFILCIIVVYIVRILPLNPELHMSQMGSMMRAAQSPNISQWEFFATQPTVIATYLRLLLFPINQNVDYDFPIQNTLSSPSTIASLFLIFGLSISALLIWKRNRLISFGILFFFLTLGVEASIIPIADVIAEHRVYLPSVGFFIAVVPLLFSLEDFLLNRVKKNRTFSKKAEIASFVLLLIVVGLATFSRNSVWKDETSLYTDIISKSPNLAKEQGNLGAALLKDGKLDEALTFLLRANELDNTHAFVLNNIGVIYLRKGNTEQAIDYFKRSLAVEPAYPNASNNLAALYYQVNDLQKAKEQYESLLHVYETDAEGHAGLGVVLFQMNKQDEGMTHLEIALRLDPGNQLYQSNYEMMRRIMGK